MPKNILSAYEKYRDTVIQKRPNLSKGGYNKGGPGNEQRRFHGTTLGCKYANDSLCQNSGCASCRIIETGFQMKFAGSGLFGKGNKILFN